VVPDPVCLSEPALIATWIRFAGLNQGPYGQTRVSGTGPCVEASILIQIAIMGPFTPPRIPAAASVVSIRHPPGASVPLLDRSLGIDQVAGSGGRGWPGT